MTSGTPRRIEHWLTCALLINSVADLMPGLLSAYRDSFLSYYLAIDLS